MATWTFSDGTVLASGGHVRGSGKAATRLRLDLEPPHRALVYVIPPPGSRAEVDPASDYLLNVLAYDVAHATKTTVESDYEPDPKDAPKEFREEIERFREHAGDAPYGTVN